MTKIHLDVFNEKSAKFCKILEKFANNGEIIDAHYLTSSWALDIFSITSFGYNINQLEKHNTNIADLVRKLIDLAYTMMFLPPHSLSLVIAKISKSGREFKCCVLEIWALMNEIIDGRKAELEKGGEHISTSKPAYYGEFLIKKALDDKLSKQQTAKLTADYLAAGFDTVAGTMSNVILMLAIFPEYQEGVYKELVGLLGKNLDRLPTWEELNNRMPYTDRILKETLRLYSPPISARKANKDIVIEDYTIPKGSTVALVFRSLHTDGKLWSHPDQFYPDHFLPENVANRPKGVFHPFSCGPRGCPGNLFAMIEMKCLLAHMIRKYKLETDLKFEELEYIYRLVIDVKNGYLIRFKQRN